jgi:acylphosphatase
MQRRRISFAGRVQGVGFRATARDAAASFPISGWVRNEPDGTVLLEAQGHPDDLDRFLAALTARMGRLVSRQESIPIDTVEDEASFHILR